MRFSLNAAPSTGQHRFNAFRSPRSNSFLLCFSTPLDGRIDRPFLPTDESAASSILCIQKVSREKTIYEREKRAVRTWAGRLVLRINRYQALKSPTDNRNARCWIIESRAASSILALLLLVCRLIAWKTN